jgi:uncharacterized protein (TIGR02172 family)
MDEQDGAHPQHENSDEIDWRGCYLPESLKDSVLFTRSQLLGLINRKRELDEERVNLDKAFNEYKRDHNQKKKEIKENEKIRAEREKEYAKAAFVLGIPTAISYDVVACGSQTGVVYEMLDAELFSVVIRADIDNIPTHGRMLAAVAKAIHEVEPAPGVFPDIKERFRGYIREMDFFLSADDIAFLLRKLEEIPDAGTCVHFDIHSSNIMIRDGEPVIIDMGDLSTGSFLFDIINDCFNMIAQI